MSKEIYEVNLTNAAPVYVEAATKNKAIRAAYATVSARKLSGSEVRALPAGTAILDATVGEQDDSDFNPGP